MMRSSGQNLLPPKRGQGPETQRFERRQPLSRSVQFPSGLNEIQQGQGEELEPRVTELRTPACCSPRGSWCPRPKPHLPRPGSRKGHVPGHVPLSPVSPGCSVTATRMVPCPPAWPAPRALDVLCPLANWAKCRCRGVPEPQPHVAGAWGRRAPAALGKLTVAPRARLALASACSPAGQEQASSRPFNPSPSVQTYGPGIAATLTRPWHGFTGQLWLCGPECGGTSRAGETGVCPLPGHSPVWAYRRALGVSPWGDGCSEPNLHSLGLGLSFLLCWNCWDVSTSATFFRAYPGTQGSVEGCLSTGGPHKQALMEESPFATCSFVPEPQHAFLSPTYWL